MYALHSLLRSNIILCWLITIFKILAAGPEASSASCGLEKIKHRSVDWFSGVMQILLLSCWTRLNKPPHPGIYLCGRSFANCLYSKKKEFCSLLISSFWAPQVSCSEERLEESKTVTMAAFSLTTLLRLVCRLPIARLKAEQGLPAVACCQVASLEHGTAGKGKWAGHTPSSSLLICISLSSSRPGFAPQVVSDRDRKAGWGLWALNQSGSWTFALEQPAVICLGLCVLPVQTITLALLAFVGWPTSCSVAQLLHWIGSGTAGV